MLKVVALFFYLSLATAQCFSQNFSFSKTFSQFSSFATSEVAYDDLRMENLTNQNLNLMWIKVSDSSPSAWDVRIEDPDSSLLNAGDTGHFVLDTQPGFRDFIACYFFPKGQPGLGTVVVDVVQADDTTQRARVSWEYRARDTATTSFSSPHGIQRLIWARGDEVHAQSDAQSDQLYVFDISGKLIQQATFLDSYTQALSFPTEQILLYQWVNTKTGFVESGKLMLGL